MKQVLSSLLAVAILFSACEKTPINPIANPTDADIFLAYHPNATTIDVSELPQRATDYIQNTYPTKSVVETEQYSMTGNTYYEVELNNSIEIHFDIDGDVMAEGESNDTYINITDLPPSIVNYINANYGNLTIISIEMEQEDNGNIIYEVEFSDGTEVYFDSNGNIVSDDDDDDDDDSTSIVNLPQIIQDYITTNYAGFTIEYAEIEDLFGDNTQQVYEVELENNSTNQEVTLYFDMNGGFIQSEVEISITTLPAAVASTISSQYGTYQLEDEASEYTRANGDIWYGVELESNSQDLELILDSNGTILYSIID